METRMGSVRTADLDIAFEESGTAGDPAIILLHGFPYDPRAYDAVVPRLVAGRNRVVVPYLRGYGATRFLRPDTLRSGQQAALGQDLAELLDALGIERAGLVGYDWGGRAACVVSALYPARVRFLVSIGGYNIQDIAAAATPADPEQERRLWYQYYFGTERGRVGLEQNRREFCRLLWRLWSPTWAFTEETYAETARSFETPDFVAVVIHSYRHRYGIVAGDPRFEATERRLAEHPAITVPTLVLHGADDGVTPAATTRSEAGRFTGRYASELVRGVGHNLPQEAPERLADAVLQLGAESPA